VILNCNFEELRALATGAELFLSEDRLASEGCIAAPSAAAPAVERLRPRLTGDLSIPTLAAQREVRRAVAAICEDLHDRLEAKVIEYHPAHEEAVSLYFDYAHAFGVLARLDEMGAEMTAMVELITGEPATDVAAAEVTFPD
jgi:hypothetical protein